jgi:4-amino-4-deoxy-L-arabinose transferase-like glycosyltransferase
VTNTWPRLLVAFACLLFLVQELPYFQTRWVEDESSYSDAAWTWSREGRIRMSMFPPKEVMSVVDVRPPAMPIALGTVFRLFGLGVWQARLLPLLCALAAIVVTYFLGSHLAGPWTGAIAALLLATDNMLFLAARTTRPEGMVVFLNALTFLLFLVAMRRGSRLAALGAGIAAGLSINFHINGAIAPIAMALWALYEFRFQVWRKSICWIFALVVIAFALPYMIWVNTDPVHQRSYREMQALGTVMQHANNRVDGELMRLRDFLGVSNQKLHLPIPVPARAPVFLLILAGLVLLPMYNRRLFGYIGILLAASVGWWFFIANKNVRYTAVGTPIFALIVAAAAVLFATTPKRRQVAILACAIYAVNQIAGNIYLAYRFHNADYVALTAALRDAVPPHESVYGANTFWLALYDRRYISYDRSPFEYTVANLKPRYLILNDRVLLNGSGFGKDDFQDVRVQTNAFVPEHADKTATIANSFYGDLEVYRVRDSVQSPRQAP